MGASPRISATVQRTAARMWRQAAVDLAHQWRLVVLVSAAKLLLLPAYRSTDFEVHRNWLAITANAPISQWYYESTSQWTLDYPPLFAYFEWALAQGARWLAPAALQLSSEPVDSLAITWFQRGSVVLTDLLLYYGVMLLARARGRRGAVEPSSVTWTLLAVGCNSGLLLLDHIHFQYNGMLLGLLLVVLACFYAGRVVAGTLAFVALVCAKHLFVVLAPVLGAYVLRWHVLGAPSAAEAVRRFVVLAGWCAGLVAAAFAPVLASGDVAANAHQLLQRLFPFGRGLVHAYWAPNAWALYLTGDKVAAAGCGVVGRRVPAVADWCAAAARALQPAAAAASNRVARTHLDATTAAYASHNHAATTLLPPVPPAASGLLVVLATLPAVVIVCRGHKPDPQRLHLAVVVAYLCAFMFGWHVHEKAVLYALVPLLPLVTLMPAADAGAQGSDSGWYHRLQSVALRLVAVAHVSLLPLIFTVLEQPVVLAMHAAYGVAVLLWLSRVDAPGGARKQDRPSTGSWLFAGCGAALLSFYYTHQVLVPAMPFLHLMAMSVVCAIGVAACWLQLYALLWMAPPPIPSKQQQ